MSIFDVIRYPVTDICSTGQMNVIPTDILIPWIRECYRFTGIDESEADRFYHQHTDWGMVSIGLVHWWIDTIERRNKREEAKALFLNMLHKHIRNYDSV